MVNGYWMVTDVDGATLDIKQYKVREECVMQLKHHTNGVATYFQDSPWADKEDLINHPSHYTSGSVECIDAIRAALTPEEFRGFCKGSVLKYVWRERHKGGVESLQKAAWYLEKLNDNSDLIG